MLLRRIAADARRVALFLRYREDLSGRLRAARGAWLPHLRAWGFEFKSQFVWGKPQLGLGNYWRIAHELLLLGRRGSPEWRARDLRSWGEFPRRGHSAKPEEVRTMIERACEGPYLELFGRRAAPGWTVWGNQVSRDLFHP